MQTQVHLSTQSYKLSSADSSMIITQGLAELTATGQWALERAQISVSLGFSRE